MATHPAQFAPGPDPSEKLLQLAIGYKASACTFIAARLKIADLLAEHPQSVSELARATQTNEDALYRVLRALASIGVFTESSPRTFSHTAASQLMRTGTADSIRDAVLWMSDPFHFRAYAELGHSVETGGTAIKKLTGSEAFEFFEQDRAEGEIFNTAMTSFSARFMPAVLEGYDFGGLGTLADVAGGHGFVLTSILMKHPDLRGILFDLPHVVSGAKSRIESLALGSRCEIVSGNFFQAVPPANSYLMKNIIHDWDDARAAEILKNCCQAMQGEGKVILIEQVILPGNDPQFAKWIDIEMLALAGGRERTEAEFAELFSRAGMRLTRVVPTKSPACLIEAVKS